MPKSKSKCKSRSRKRQNDGAVAKKPVDKEKTRGGPKRKKKLLTVPQLFAEKQKQFSVLISRTAPQLTQVHGFADLIGGSKETLYARLKMFHTLGLKEETFDEMFGKVLAANNHSWDVVPEKTRRKLKRGVVKLLKVCQFE